MLAPTAELSTLPSLLATGYCLLPTAYCLQPYLFSTATAVLQGRAGGRRGPGRGQLLQAAPPAPFWLHPGHPHLPVRPFQRRPGPHPRPQHGRKRWYGCCPQQGPAGASRAQQGSARPGKDRACGRGPRPTWGAYWKPGGQRPSQEE